MLADEPAVEGVPEVPEVPDEAAEPDDVDGLDEPVEPDELDELDDELDEPDELEGIPDDAGGDVVLLSGLLSGSEPQPAASSMAVPMKEIAMRCMVVIPSA